MSLKKLWIKYFLTRKFSVLILGISMLLEMVLLLINPEILGSFINEIIEGRGVVQLISMAGLFIFIAVMQQFLNVFNTFLSQKNGWIAINQLKGDLIHKFLNLQINTLKGILPGEILTRIEADTAQMLEFFSVVVVKGAMNSILVVGIILLLFQKHWLIGITITIFILFTIGILFVMERTSGNIWDKERESNANLFSKISESIGNMEDAATCGAKQYCISRITQAMGELLPEKVKAMVKSNNIWVFTSLLFLIGNILALGISSFLFLNGAISLGTIYVVFKYTDMLKEPIENINSQVQQVLKTKSCFARISSIFDAKSEERENHTKEMEEVTSLEFQNVSFQYDEGTEALKNISFTVHKGEKLGIAGRTGSGKSTIGQLILRFYDVDQGVILLNKVDIKNYSLTQYRREITYIAQEISLVTDTLRENIRIYDTSITDQKILQVIKQLEVLEWFTKFKDGLDTSISTNLELSDGETQIIMLIRAYVRDSQIIIMDESTSKIDPETEKILDNAMKKSLNGKICIVIAHHMKLLKEMDKILILENGIVKEYGAQEELRNMCKSVFGQLHGEM